MDATNYLPILGVTAGIVYLLIAVVASNNARRRQAAEAEAEAGRVILAIEDTNGLVEGESTADRMHKLAGLCASIGRRVFEEEFDFTAESIARLDRLIVSGWGDAELADVEPTVLLTFGAYIGEVLVRRTRGRWVSGWTDEEPATVLLLTRDDETVNVSPFLLVREKFEKMYTFDLSIAFTALQQKLKELQAA